MYAKQFSSKQFKNNYTEFNLNYPSECIPCRDEPLPNPFLLKLAGYNKYYPKYNIKELRGLIEHPGVHRLIIPIFKRTCTRILVAAELCQRYLLQTTRVCDNFVQQSWASSLKLGGSAVTKNKKNWKRRLRTTIRNRSAETLHCEILILFKIRAPWKHFSSFPNKITMIFPFLRLRRP